MLEKIRETLLFDLVQLFSQSTVEAGLDHELTAMSCIPCGTGRATRPDSGLYRTFIMGSEGCGSAERYSKFHSSAIQISYLVYNFRSSVGGAEGSPTVLSGEGIEVPSDSEPGSRSSPPLDSENRSEVSILEHCLLIRNFFLLSIEY